MLEDAGLRPNVRTVTVADPTQDGIVIAQEPEQGSTAVAGDRVRINVGRFFGNTDTTPTRDRTGHDVSGRLRVAVLRGGRSSEHEISLLSAASVLEALDPTRYDAVPITIDRQGRWSWPDGAPVDLQLGADRALDVDVVMPVLHGPFGEDGTVQGLLEMAGVAYVGAGVLGASLTMDKDVAKAVLRDAGVAGGALGHAARRRAARGRWPTASRRSATPCS